MKSTVAGTLFNYIYKLSLISSSFAKQYCFDEKSLLKEQSWSWSWQQHGLGFEKRTCWHHWTEHVNKWQNLVHFGTYAYATINSLQPANQWTRLSNKGVQWRWHFRGSVQLQLRQTENKSNRSPQVNISLWNRANYRGFGSTGSRLIGKIYIRDMAYRVSFQGVGLSGIDIRGFCSSGNLLSSIWLNWIFYRGNGRRGLAIGPSSCSRFF